MNIPTLQLMRKTAILATLALVVTGCASTGNPKDPWEGVNRAMFSVNEAVDRAALKPAAKAYDDVLPSPVKTAIANIFSNIDDVFIGFNSVIQGKPLEGLSDWGRFAINTTVGVLGVFDWASDWGLEKHDEDFGQTFGKWGAEPGPFVMLPLVGPKTVRDTVGFVVDGQVSPVGALDHVPTRNSLTALRLISLRASLLPADKVIDEAALDKYAYIRDAYLQRRRSLVFDGNAPRESIDD